MRLEELLSVLNLNCNVDVYKVDSNDLLTSYDGKDSIDSKYKDWRVDDVYAANHKFFEVFIREA